MTATPPPDRLAGSSPEPAADPTAETADLRAQIADLQRSLEAIRAGAVDAVVVGGPAKEQVYTLVSADQPYRVLVEEMGDGALTVSQRGVVLYANRRACLLTGRARSTLLGGDATQLVVPEFTAALTDLLATPPGDTRRAELELRPPADAGPPVAVLASSTGLQLDGVVVRCLLLADLTEQRRAAAAVFEAREALLRQSLELREEHRIKEALQRAVLPNQLPDATGLRLAARYLAADSPALVGGDWYDAFCLPDTGLAIAVGDVVGHDLTAAATMTAMRNALRAYAFANGAPSAVLSRLNQLTAGLGEGGLATAVHGRLDLTDRTLSWSQAGHPPPLLITPGGARLLQPPRGAMLGADHRTSFVDARTTIGPTDTLVLYTDGLIERRDRDLDAGFHALHQAAADLGTASPDHVCDALLDRLLPHAAHEDDVCLLAVGASPA